MRELGIGNWVSKRSQYTPERTAIIFEGKEWTYKQYSERINQLENGLLSLGLKKGDRLAIMSSNCNQYLELYWACAKIGIVLVPLNFRLVSRELEYFLKECEVKCLFYGSDHSLVVQELKDSPSMKIIQTYVCIGQPEMGEDIEHETFIKDFSTHEPEIVDPPTLEDPQIIMFTSGTTGTQKGAILPHRKTLWNAINNEMSFEAIGQNTRYLLNLPLFHSGGMFIATMPVTHRGGMIVIHKNFNPKLALEDIEKYKINFVGGVPTMMYLIIEDPDFDKYDVSSVTSVAVGGQITPISLLEKIKEKFKVIAVCQAFGCTETSTIISLTQDRPLDSKKTGSIGLPLFHGEVKVISDEGKEVAWGSGEIGEICYRGPMNMLGYLNMADKTREAIDHDGWFHFGDMASIDDDGYIYVVDRKSDMYISGGENVYPREVENILINHPKIAEIAIIPKPDEKWGEVGLAIVNLIAGEILTLEELLEFGQGKIAKYKLPKEIIVTDTPIPMTVTGKILKYNLINKYVTKG